MRVHAGRRGCGKDVFAVPPRTPGSGGGSRALPSGTAAEERPSQAGFPSRASSSATPGTAPAGVARDPDGAPRAVQGPAGPELDKAEFIPSLFDRIARHYDLMNIVMTAGVWRMWQRAFRRHCGIPAGAKVLDVGCGTAELSLLLSALVGPAGRVVGVDISPGMLAVARSKVMASGEPGRIDLLLGDALDLGFPDASFDAAASAFVMRNVADLDRAFAEMVRVVRPAGRIAILELSHPPASLIRRPFLFYFRRILPLIGTWAAKARLPVAPYAWLPRSLETFPEAEEVAARMARAGMTDVTFRRLSAGIVCLHTARVG